MTGDIHPERFAADSQEQLYESARTVVVRLYLAGGTKSVIHKAPRGPGAQKRLGHERAVLERLAGVEGVVRLAAAEWPSEGMLLEDSGAVPLSTTISRGPMAVTDLLSVALDLAAVVGAVHRHGVIHKDITPANVIWSAATHQLSLIDFDMSTTFAEERPNFIHQNEIAGTLAYIAPEQTGRTGHPMDQRADLYGLGATLYALATGTPPFGFGDPLQLVHDHLAQVPVAPVDRNPAVPAALSDIILRLLEKEPDRRYQSAEGLVHDLGRVRDAWSRGEDRPMPLGERDFPLRLSAPSRMVGRTAEVNALATALTVASSEGALGAEGGRGEGLRPGRASGLLVSGAPGVGKTTLLDHLRPMVTGRGGWFVTGKFDQYRQDHQDSDAVWQALRGLGRLLLAEPEEEIVELRARIQHCLGGNAGLATAVLPEFASLLQVPAQPAQQRPEGDPFAVQTRLQQIGLDLLRAVASPNRPVVVVVDDLQWAAPTPLGFMDAVIIDENLRGVLLVGAYRENEVGPTHPLTALLARWQRLGAAPTQLRLANLPAEELRTFLGEILRIGPKQAASIAAVIGERSRGNPYDTLELVNALRRDGALTVDADGWRWDAGTLRRYLGYGDVVDLLTTRMDGLPQPTTVALETMSCLGGEVRLDTLAKASDLPVQRLEDQLLPALEDGLLVMDSGGGSVRFRHDRVQQAAFGRLATSERAALRLLLARRLATAPGLEANAAEQYLQVLDGVDDLAERRAVVGLFRTAAAQARLVANHATVERFVAAAISFLAPDETTLLVELATERHAALYSLGRLDEADEVYRWITELTTDPLERSEATWVQISSLTNRDRPREAVALGLDLMRQLGRRVPEDPERLSAEIGPGLDAMYRWFADGDETDDLRRPVCDEPRVVALARTINRAIPPAFFSDQVSFAWLVAEAARMWAEYGPSAALVGPLSNTAFALTPLRNDYRTGYQVVRRILAVGEARGYEPDTSQCRFAYALSSAAWFDPLEEVVHQARRAHDGLVRNGDLHFASHTFYITVPGLIDCAASVDQVLAEADAALAFCAHTGNEQAAAAFVYYRQFARAMRGETQEPGGFTDASFDEVSHLAALPPNPTTGANAHVARGLSAALFGDFETLAEHAGAAMALVPFVQATYPTTTMHVLQALVLAERARTRKAEERAAVLSEFDVHRDWLAERAEDAPGNFRHLLGLLEAERAWAVDDFRVGAAAFDTALRDVTPRQRPWHRALIAERSGLFQLEHGLERGGYALLCEARRCYASWGATAKVAELDRRYPILRTFQGVAVYPRPPDDPASTPVSTRVSTLALTLASAGRSPQRRSI